MKKQGRADALSLQDDSVNMTDTEIVEQSDLIPYFSNAVANKNMDDRTAGFLVRDTDENVYYLIQTYNSDTFTQTPPNLPAQWGNKWTQNPEDARPFVSLSTAVYNTGDCCTWEDQTWRSTIDNNVWSPTDYPTGWEVVDLSA